MGFRDHRGFTKLTEKLDFQLGTQALFEGAIFYRHFPWNQATGLLQAQRIHRSLSAG